MSSAVQAILKGSPAVSLPPFLLVVFPLPSASRAARRGTQVACSVSAAATLRSLMDAGHLKTACKMVEDYVEQYVLHTPSACWLGPAPLCLMMFVHTFWLECIVPVFW